MNHVQSEDIGMRDVEIFLDSLPCPAYALDGDGRVKLWNRECERVSGIFRDEVINTFDCWKLYFKERKDTPSVKLLKSNKDYIEEEIIFKNKKYKALAFRLKEFVVEIAIEVDGDFERISYLLKDDSLNNLKLLLSKLTRNLMETEHFEVYLKTIGGYKLVVRKPQVEGDEIINFKHQLAKIVSQCSSFTHVIEGNTFTSEFKDLHCYVVPLSFRDEIVGFSQLCLKPERKFENRFFSIWRNLSGLILKLLCTEYELKEKIQWLKCALEVCNEGIVFIDKNLRIIYSNKFFEDLTGYSKKVSGLKIETIIPNQKQIDFVIKQALLGDVGECKTVLVKKNGERLSCNLRVEPIILEGGPVFCCSISRADVDDMLKLYEQIFSLILAEKSYTSLFAKLCKILEKTFSEIAFIWCCVKLENPKIYSPKRRIERSLINNRRLIKCLYKFNDYESNALNCKNCYIYNIYRNGYYCCFPTAYRGKVYGIFGIVFKTRPDEMKLKILKNIVETIGFAARCIELGRNVEFLISGIQEEISKVRTICDKLVNPVSGTTLLLEGLIEEFDDLSREEIKEKIEICYKQLKKLSETTELIREIEEELLKRIEKF